MPDYRYATNDFPGMGSKRRYLAGQSIDSAEPEELTGSGPSTAEWLRLRVERHRIGDAELIPSSRWRKASATPEGDLAV